MKLRIITAFIFSLLYIIFLAWYDGWGMEPYTSEEIDNLAIRMEQAEGSTPEQLKNLILLLKEDDGKEFFMLNLNRYEYAENEAKEGVPKAYQDYGLPVIWMILARAGHPIYSAEIPNYLLDGEVTNNRWDEVIIVRYRSRKDFFNMVTSDEYLKIFNNRIGGMDYAEVSATTSSINFTSPRLFVLLIFLGLTLLLNYLIRRVLK
ncbi:MAG: hypothetical protein ACJ0F4_02205 [Gammaproteobacteria bacterium]